MIYVKQLTLLGPTKASGFVSISARMPVGGYALGETINLHVEINNKTQHPLLYVSVFLVNVSSNSMWTHVHVRIYVSPVY